MGCIAVIHVALLLLLAGVGKLAKADDTNSVFNPCSDTLVQKSDGFTFGVTFAARDSFYLNTVEYSPCDSRLGLSSSHLAVFRPKVDEITLLTINTTAGSFSPEQDGGYMVAFAGHNHAARSTPTFVANQTLIITSFTLVLDFNKGRLQNLFWKTDGCNSCQGKSSFVCYRGQSCAIKLSDCKNKGGSVDCSLGIQLAFSGTDKHDSVFNSWYEISNLRQYSLFGLYSNLKNSLTSQYGKYF
jgi:hypothetical protein